MGSKPGRDAKLPDAEQIKRSLRATAYKIVVRLFGPRLTPKVAAGVAVTIFLVVSAAEIWSKINSSESFLASIGHSIKNEYLEFAARRNAARVRANPTPGSTFQDHLYSPEMVVVPAGKFLMGAPSSEDDFFDYERPQHPVAIGYSFAIGRFPVTSDEYMYFTSHTGRAWPEQPFPRNGKNPVVNVSGYDAQDYVAWLSKKTKQKYRLLSESEYEYAERAGSTTTYWWGNSHKRDEMCAHANGRDCLHNGALPVGDSPANPFGLSDMAGNVWSWTEDCWHDSYAGKPPPDGAAWMTGDCLQRVERGGSWNTQDDAVALGSAEREPDSPNVHWPTVGFRVATTF